MKYRRRARKRYRKLRKKPWFKKQRKIRRKHPERFKIRKGGVLTAPEIAFVYGEEDASLGYVRSVSPTTGYVTFFLEKTKMMYSLPVMVFSNVVTFASENDIDAFFNLIDAEQAGRAFRNVTPSLIKDLIPFHGLTSDQKRFKRMCEDITGEEDLDDMSPDQLARVEQALYEKLYERDPDEEMAEIDNKEDLIDPTDTIYYYGEVNTSPLD